MTKSNSIKPSSMTVAEFISTKLNASEKTQQQVATEVGFESANIVSMITRGIMKLPIERVAALAKALDVDQVYLLRLALSEYQPSVLNAIEEMLAVPLLTEHERKLIRQVRTVVGTADVGFDVEYSGSQRASVNLVPSSVTVDAEAAEQVAA